MERQQIYDHHKDLVLQYAQQWIEFVGWRRRNAEQRITDIRNLMSELRTLLNEKNNNHPAAIALLTQHL